MPVVFLKLGGSFITDKRGDAALRADTLTAAAQEIARARRDRPDLALVVGHGSGSFGHVAARRTGLLTGRGDWSAYAEVAAAAARLNRHVADALLATGVPAVSFPPSASTVATEGRVIDLSVLPIQRVLAGGAVPLVFGDVAVDVSRDYCIVSTETVFTYLAEHLRPSRIVLAGQVDGVFSADPLVHPTALPVSHLTPGSWTEVASSLEGAAGVDVTGGMRAKVRAMFDLVHAHPDLTIHLLSGLRPGAIHSALVGVDPGGTTLHA